LLLKTNPIYSYKFSGTRHDCGTKIGFIKANIAFALNDPNYSDDLKIYIKNLL